MGRVTSYGGLAMETNFGSLIEHTAGGVMDRTGWDVIVVGAGSSGAALAARLAAQDKRVLLLEAGPDYLACRPGRRGSDAERAAYRFHSGALLHK